MNLSVTDQRNRPVIVGTWGSGGVDHRDGAENIGGAEGGGRIISLLDVYKPVGSRLGQVAPSSTGSGALKAGHRPFLLQVLQSALERSYNPELQYKRK